MEQQKEWTVIFLVDSNPPRNILLLKRAANKSFAPNYFTGIGGKVGDLPGFENESPLESAYRELEEETEGELGKKNIKLNEFAKCVYESGLAIYYFWGTHDRGNTPRISESDGTLVWVKKDNLFDNDIIPTTQSVCNEWKKRDFALDRPFTVIVKEVGKKDTVRLVEIQRVQDGIV